MFSQVVCPQGGLCQGDPPIWLCAVDTHPTGMHSCFFSVFNTLIFFAFLVIYNEFIFQSNYHVLSKGHWRRPRPIFM